VIEPTNWWKTKLVKFVAEHTPKCHDITRLISESMDRPVSLRTRIAIRIHYVVCAWCERYRDQLGFLREAVRSFPTEDPEKIRGKLSPETRTRLKVALQPKE
jgi:hypothetical protein